MMNVSAKSCCLYCGAGLRQVRRGEHIVPEVIGGALTIKQVCTECNNGVLSDLDRELCSRSPLSVIAAQAIDAHIWQTWDVDHSSRRLLVEAKPDFNQKSMTLYPQVVFEPRGPHIRGDYEEMCRFGADEFRKVLVKFALEAFRAYEAGEKRRLIMEPMALNSTLLQQYRFPPRLFARRPIREFRKGMSFVLRYQNNEDRRFAMAQLEAWEPDKDWRGYRYEVGLGSQLPAIRCFWDVEKTLRALAKIGVNLLAKYCPRTSVNRRSFLDVIGAIRGEVELDSSVFRNNGFVWPSDFDEIRFGDGHAFRLLHDHGWWRVFSSFFGGRVCSVVVFKGPNEEDWSCMDVRAPLGSPNWMTKAYNLLLPLRCHVEWEDVARIIPSAGMVNTRSELVVERR
jgi:hypothetical protein